jgi:hypothetical protein
METFCRRIISITTAAEIIHPVKYAKLLEISPNPIAPAGAEQQLDALTPQPLGLWRLHHNT